MNYYEALARLEKLGPVHVSPTGATARCPAHNDNQPSLGIVRLPNGEACFTCFAGCKRDIVTVAVCGFPVSGKVIERPEDDRPTYDYQRYALQLWGEAKILTAWSPVAAYLYKRGLSDHHYTDDLRYHPHLKHPQGGDWPAMIAAVTNAEHDIVGIHRTFLTVGGDKAPVTPSKMMLGHCAGGAVRFLHRHATLTPTVFIAEGIETALSIKALFGSVTVYAGLSVYGMRSVSLEPGIKNVVIVADGDEPDSVAFKAAQRVVAAFLDRGYKSYLLRCHRPGMDFNDILLEGKSEARLSVPEGIPLVIPRVTE